MILATLAEVKAVAEGRKTQLRRSSIPAGFVAGSDHPVRTRGTQAACRVRILRPPEQQRLGDITHREARLEGHRGTARFKVRWVEQHDQRWADSSEEATLDRFQQRYADWLVWVVSFARVQDVPRLLASQPDILSGRTADGNGHGDYTTALGRTIDPEAEAVDADTVERYAKAAEAEGQRQRASFKRDLEAARMEHKAQRNAARGCAMREHGAIAR